MKNLRFMLICLLLIFSISFNTNAGTRSGGGSVGSSRSSSSSSKSWGSSKPSTSSSKSSGSSWGTNKPSSSSNSKSSWGSSKPKTTAPSSGASQPSNWGTSKPSSSPVQPSTTVNKFTGKLVSSAADRAAYDKAKMSGKAFSNKAEAISDFKTKNASRYRNKFDREPFSRSDYIPISASVGGRNATIIYNQNYGGYGYYDPFFPTRWIMYDALSDAIWMNTLMSRQGYYVGETSPITYTRRSFSIVNGMIAIIVLLIFGVIIVAVIKRS